MRHQAAAACPPHPRSVLVGRGTGSGVGSDAGRGWARGRARGRRGLGAGLPVHRALASVPGQQPLVEEPGERRPLPPRPLGLLQEHEVVVRLAQAGVLLLLPPAEEQLGASPQKAAWKGKARGLVRGPRGRVEKGVAVTAKERRVTPRSHRCRRGKNSRIWPVRSPGVCEMK